MALKSKFAKKSSQFKANKIFTDRVEPRAVFGRSVAQIVAAQDETHSRQIVVFYGKGGIGKTCLLKQLAQASADTVYAQHSGYRFHNICISLEAYDYANPVNVLTAIRSMLHGDGSLFDYALLQYYAKARVSVEEIKAKNTHLPSMVVDILNETIGICTASASIPKALLEKGVDFIKDLRFRAKYKEEIQELAELGEFEIFQRLPYYLGLCISHSADNGVLHVLFMDSYESLQARTEGMVSSADSTEWLQELFLASDRALFVIGSRDRLDWEKQDEDWNLYLNQHLLTNLSDEDCRWFLERVPIADRSGQLRQDVIGDIIRHAGGVPLYLDLCTDLFEAAVNSGSEPDFSQLRGSHTIIDRYMRHLKQKDQYAVSILSTLKSFDCDFALTLLQKQNLLYHIGELYALLEKSIFTPLEGSQGLWKVDESVRSHIFDQMLPKWRVTLLSDLLDVVLENRGGGMYPYFTNALELVTRHPDYIDPVHHKLFEALEYFSGIGYWNELRFVMSAHLTSADSGLNALAVFTELIWLRRTGNLDQADSFAREHPLHKDDMGVWHYMYRFLRIHIRHLLGHYDQSVLDYRELLREMELIRNVIPNHIYSTVAIKHADLLFLKGHFEESLVLTEKLLSSPGTLLPDIVELLRIKGHIFRFQKLYREAALIYESALKLVLDHGLRSLEGKLYTNLTEANCLIDPQAAMDWYKKALEKNIQMNNEIEVGKAQAAASVALTTLGQYARGAQLARTSVVTAEITGYRSGKMFALLTLSYAHRQAGAQQDMDTALTQARELAAQLGVYQYILPPQ